MTPIEVQERFATFVLGRNVQVYEIEGQLYVRFEDVAAFGVTLENLWREKIVLTDHDSAIINRS